MWENTEVTDIGDGETRVVYGYGAVYYGGYVNGKREGRGVYISGESKYEGEFRNDLKHGKGKFEWPNGDTYEGDYRYGMRDGVGVLKTREEKYEGQFRCDKKHGVGTRTVLGDSHEVRYENGVLCDSMQSADGMNRSVATSSGTQSAGTDRSVDVESLISEAEIKGKCPACGMDRIPYYVVSQYR